MTNHEETSVEELELHLVAAAAIDEYTIGDCKGWYETMEVDDEFKAALAKVGVHSIEDLEKWFERRGNDITRLVHKVFDAVLKEAKEL